MFQNRISQVPIYLFTFIVVERYLKKQLIFSNRNNQNIIFINIVNLII